VTEAIRSQWILDGTGRSFANHALVWRDGEVVEVSSERTADTLHLGHALIIPGLVNAHVHLDLSLCPRQEAPSFVSWVRRVISHRLSLSPEETREAIQKGVDESLASGVTMVGDISSGSPSWEVLEKAGLRGTVYYECLGLSPARVDGNLNRFEEWLATHEPTAHLQPGISPHAPYSTAKRIYRYAAACGLPVATHIAESQEEIEFLATGEGPFKELLIDLGIDPHLVDIDHAEEVGDLFKSTRFPAFVQGNQCPELWEKEWRTGHNWIHCPRTHRFFGHKVHPFESDEFDPKKWCLATDGRSSNPDLNLLEEAKLIHAQFPKIAPAQLLAMVTHQPARLLGWGHKAGSLERGKWADFLVFRSTGSQSDSEEPHAALMAGHWKLAEVWIGGIRKIAVST
jgi:cytosine/adenosine deaminase-related metal-dependent hydrolase